jgi:hypothetical protein
LRALLDRNQTALEHLEAGVRRGRLQYPLVHGDDALKLNGNFTQDIHCLGLVLWVRAKTMRTDGDMLGACRLLVEQLQIGAMICNGDGMVVDSLMGCWSRRSAINQIRMIASRSETPVAVLRELLPTIDHCLASPDGLAQCMRVDFCQWDLVKVNQLPDADELETFVDRLLNLYPRNFVTLTDAGKPEIVTPSDGRLAWRREQIISLLRGHPCPFDKIATVQRLGKLVVARIRSMDYFRRPGIVDFGYALRRLVFRANWRRCWRQPRNMRYWPAQFTPDFSAEWLGHGESARAALASLGELMDGKQLASLQPPSEADVDMARHKLRRVHNPVGWMLAKCFMATDVRSFAHEYRTALEETRKLLIERLNV